MENQELYHHGVKGQKWGVRRTPTQLGHRPSNTRKKPTIDMAKIRKSTVNGVKATVATGKKAAAALSAYKAKRRNAKAEEEARKNAEKEAKRNRFKSVKKMSDVEIRDKIARMKLEKEYKDLLTQTGRAKVEKGAKWTANIINRSAETLLPQLLNHYGAKAINQAIGDKDKDGKIIERVFANNKKK